MSSIYCNRLPDKTADSEIQNSHSVYKRICLNAWTAPGTRVSKDEAEILSQAHREAIFSAHCLQKACKAGDNSFGIYILDIIVLDTEGVQLFVMAADMLNISAAGRQLGLAPAVASARLAKLEKQLGADLLHRSTRKISLSLEGAEFLPYAREILAQEDAARAAMGHGGTEVSGTLRLSASSTFAQLYIAPVLPEFLDRYPDVNLELKLSDTQINLIEGGFDLALRNYAIEDSSLRARKLADDHRILCASDDYLARRGTPQSPEELANHRLLMFMNGSTRKLLKDGEASLHTFPPANAPKRVICDDGASMRIATRAGAGISMNSYWSVHDDIQSGALQRVLPQYEIEDESAIWLVYPKSNVLTAKVRVFIDFLLERASDLPTWQHQG